jgi:hypothetical protein
MEPYVHEVVLAIAAAAALFFKQWAITSSIAILGAIDDVLGSVKTRVDATSITWGLKYGIALGEVAIADIRRVEIARAGFNFWSLAGYQAVAITRRNWRVVTVGTDEPEALIAAIERFRT